MRTNININLFPGTGHPCAVNGSCLENEDCHKMLQEWIEQGKTLDLHISTSGKYFELQLKLCSVKEN